MVVEAEQFGSAVKMSQSSTETNGIIDRNEPLSSDSRLGHLDCPKKEYVNEDGGESSTSDRGSLIILKHWLPTLGVPATLLGVLLMSVADIFLEFSTQTIDGIQVSLLFNIGQLSTAICAVFLCAVKDRNIIIYRCSRSCAFYLIFCALASGTGFITYVLAIEFLPVGDAVSLIRVMPVFAGIIGCLFLKQPLRVIDVPFILMCVTGVVLIARPTFIFRDQADATEGTKLLGTLCAIACAFCLAVSFSIGKKIANYNIHVSVTISLNSAMTLLLTTILLFASWHWDCLTVSVIVFAVIAGILTSLGQMLVFWSVSREKVVVVTVIMTSNIIFTYIFQIIFVKIMPHWLSGVGAALILTACIGMALRKNQSHVLDSKITDVQA